MSNCFFKLLLFSFFVLVLLIFPNFILAADPPPCECASGPCCDGCNFRPSSFICDSWPDYGCAWGTGCGSDVGINTYTQFCSGNSEGCDGNTTESGWTVAYPCSEWQVCAGTACACSNNCLETPTGPYPANNDENVKLPVTLMWNAVPGAQSYRYKIEGITEGVTTTPYIMIKNCTLKSNSNYNWHVQACCDTAGNSCGGWSNLWTFKTSLAPELLYPVDNAEEVALPVTFDWCNVENIKSYCFRLYYQETGREVFPPWLIQEENGLLASELTLDLDWLTKDTTYKWQASPCLNENGTKCGLDCGDGQNCSECGESSQQWQFKTISEIGIPELVAPKSTEGIPAVNLSSSLEWKAVKGALSYRYQILAENGIDEILNSTSGVYVVPFSSFWDELNFNTAYKWRAASCWDEKGGNCETEQWSAVWEFETTGEAPAIVSPQNGTTVEIPVKLDWEGAAGAASYKIEVSLVASFSTIETDAVIKSYEASELSLSYPQLKMETGYWWRISTCADQQGEKCGIPAVQTFTTSRITPPVLLFPEANGTATVPVILNWEKVDSVFYEYWLVSEGQTVEKNTVPCCSAYLPDLEKEKQYQWKVRSCYDLTATDQVCGDWSNEQSFQVGEITVSAGGFVPCGRKTDNPNTSYDETESCQLKHIFLLIKNILDFILWRLGLIILALLTLAVGVIYYFSMGAPATMIQVKSILKSAGIGYGIIFLAWLIINWILVILGFQLGNWWQINF